MGAPKNEVPPVVEGVDAGGAMDAGAATAFAVPGCTSFSAGFAKLKVGAGAAGAIDWQDGALSAFLASGAGRASNCDFTLILDIACASISCFSHLE